MSFFYIDSPSEGILRLTSTTKVNIREDAKATSHPIEDGSEVTDNVVNSNASISFNGIISDIKSFSPYLTSGTSFNDQKSVQDYISALRRIKDKKERFTVYFDSRFSGFNDCIITEFSLDTDSNTFKAYQVQLGFKQLRVARRARITVTEDTNAQQKQDKDSSNTERVGVDPDAPERSIFGQGVGFVGGGDTGDTDG